MQRKDLLVAAGVTAVISIGWYQFVWQSQTANESKAKTAASVSASAAGTLKSQVTSLERTKAGLEAKAGLEQQLDLAIPDTPALSPLIKELQAMATARQVTLAQIGNGPLVLKEPVVVTAPPTTAGDGKSTTATTKPAVVPAGATEMTITLAMTGEYQNLLSFADSLSSMKRLVVVEAMTVNQAQSAAEPGQAVAAGTQLSATITARVFTTAKPSVSDPNGTPTETTAPAANAANAAAPASAGGTGPTTTLQGGL